MFPLVFVPVGLAGAIDALFHKYFILGFSGGFVLIGMLCWFIGRRWKNAGRDDRFCGPTVKTWGIIYFCFGALLIPAAIHSALLGF